MAQIFRLERLFDSLLVTLLFLLLMRSIFTIFTSAQPSHLARQVASSWLFVLMGLLLIH